MIDPATRAVRRVLRGASEGRERRRRIPPPVRLDPDHTGAPVIYYLSPDDDRPSGGIRNLYRHVDLLNQEGIPAAVMHHRPGFRCTWFDNQTRTAYATTVRVGLRDILVVPEFYGPGLGHLPAEPRKVVF
ncbi:MAG TPA: hypothetical protein VF163_05125, partial [Micromonosporaceae bacterium]